MQMLKVKTTSPGLPSIAFSLSCQMMLKIGFCSFAGFKKLSKLVLSQTQERSITEMKKWAALLLFVTIIPCLLLCDSTENNISCEPQHPWFKEIIKECRGRKCGDKCMITCSSLHSTLRSYPEVGALQSCDWDTKKTCKNFCIKDDCCRWLCRDVTVKRCVTVPS